MKGARTKALVPADTSSGEAIREKRGSLIAHLAGRENHHLGASRSPTLAAPPRPSDSAPLIHGQRSRGTPPAAPARGPRNGGQDGNPPFPSDAKTPPVRGVIGAGHGMVTRGVAP